MVDVRIDEIGPPRRDEKLHELTALRRAYEEQRRSVNDEVDDLNERPPEDGKGVYIDVFA